MRMCLFSGGVLTPWCILLLSLNGANSASLVGGTILLCANGYSTDGSSCTTYAKGNICNTGYVEHTGNAESFIGLYDGKCQVSTYKRTTVPDTLVTLRYSGIIAGDSVTLCGRQYSTNGTSCSSYSRGLCANNYLEYTANESSFIGPYNGKCQISNYKKTTVPDTFVTLTYHGIIAGDSVSLCNGGYSTNGSACTNYSVGNCPNDYHNISFDDTSVVTKSGSCGTGYNVYAAEETCGFAPESSSCVNICGSGQLSTALGTCASLCSLGATTLRTSTGLIIPMWSTKQATPSINIGFGGGTCYVNLATGDSSDAIMIQDSGVIYHTLK